MRCESQGFAPPSLSAKTGDETILRKPLRKPAEIAKIDIITKIRAKTRVSWSELPSPRSGRPRALHVPRCAHLARANMPTRDHLGRYPASWAVTGSTEAIGAVETPTGPHGGCDQRTP